MGMVAVCLPSRPRRFRSTSPSRTRVNRFNRRAPRTTPAAMATATSVITTATKPLRLNDLVHEFRCAEGTYAENRDHAHQQHSHEDQRNRAVGHRGDQHLGRGQDRNHLLVMGRRRGHRSTTPGQVALNGRRAKALAMTSSGSGGSVARSPDSSATRSSSSRRPDKHSRVMADPRPSPGDCTFNPQTPTKRWVRDWNAASAVILVTGTTRTDRLTKPLRNCNTPPTTEYFLTCHCAMAIAMTSANRAALTHHGAPRRS